MNKSIIPETMKMEQETKKRNTLQRGMCGCLGRIRGARIQRKKVRDCFGKFSYTHNVHPLGEVFATCCSIMLSEAVANWG